MDIKDFVAKFTNYPVLFVGTGLSLRYLKNSYSWDKLLEKICCDFKDNDSEYYLDIKARHCVDGCFEYDAIASEIEQDFNKYLEANRNGRFKFINDLFYDNMRAGVKISRFKLYIAHIFMNLDFQMMDEITELKKARKNISSIITTNYDCMLEEIFEFETLVGNDILLSNPYGSLYKIHGSVEQPDKIIITRDDYDKFSKRYELIRAQLLSLFIHHPIIFIGYGVGDKNIKELLKTIFTYVDPNSEMASRVRDNFLLIEYEAGSYNHEVVEHDIDMEGFATVRINKLKTDDYTAIYNCISDLQLPVSAMDIRKVQNVVKDIYAGGEITVSITDDIDEISNHDKVLVIGSKKTIQYTFQTASEVMKKYFSIIEEENKQIIALIDKFTIQNQQYFPIFGFSKINPDIECAEKLKAQQIGKITALAENIREKYVINENCIKRIQENPKYAKTYKIDVIACALLDGKLQVDEVGSFLKAYNEDEKKKNPTAYRKLLCTYDYVKYGK